jgi:hypothetical protein
MELSERETEDEIGRFEKELGSALSSRTIAAYRLRAVRAIARQEFGLANALTLLENGIYLETLTALMQLWICQKKAKHETYSFSASPELRRRDMMLVSALGKHLSIPCAMSPQQESYLSNIIFPNGSRIWFKVQD